MNKSKLLTLGLVAAATMVASNPAQAAVTLGGANGWEVSTDGIVDVFATYHTNGAAPTGPSAKHSGGLIGANQDQFGVGIGLLPSVIAINVKAPTTDGIDSKVRVGIYPTISNKATTENPNRFETTPNVDFREFFYTAKGSYGELLAGRALNLYQGKNILSDMTLLTAGNSPGGAHGGTTLGHIGTGYLYTNFGPQLRYTTPDMSGAKVAVSVGEPYNITNNTAETKTPRLEAELSYAKTFGDTAVQGWLSGLYQNAKSTTGKSEDSIGGAYGVGAGFSGINLLFSGYGGTGLGMISVQDGVNLGGLGADADGKMRFFWGFLAQATYKVTPSVMLGLNYGQSRMNETDLDKTNRAANALIDKQESMTASVTYNLNKFTQFIGEYTFSQDTWFDKAKRDSNQVAFGTMFYW